MAEQPLAEAAPRFTGRAPCLWLLIPFILGVWSWDAGGWCYAACLLALMILAARWLGLSLRIAGLLLVFFILGTVRMAVVLMPPPLAEVAPDETALIRLRCRVAEDARAAMFPLTTENETPGMPFRATLLLDVIAWIDEQGVARPVHGRCRLSTPDVLDIRYGDLVDVLGGLRSIRPAGNPGAMDFAAWCRRRGITHTMTIDGAAHCRRVAEARWHPLAKLYDARAAMTGLLARHLHGGDLALYATVLLGNRSRMEMEARDAFVESGTMHLLAISGLHLVLWAGMLGGLLHWLRVPERPRGIAVLLFSTAYVLLVGGAPPAMRALIMIWIYTGARLLNRSQVTINTLALAALLILLASPAELWSSGFAMSFLAVYGLAEIAPRFSAWWLREDPAASEAARLLGNRRRPVEHLRRFVLESMALSLGSMVMILPITWYAFNVVSFAAILANILGGLALIGMLAGGVVLLAAAAWLPAFAPSIAGLAVLFSRFLTAQAAAFAELPGGHVYLPAIPLALVALYYLAVLAALLDWRAAPRRFSAGLVVAVAAVLVVGAATLRRRPPEDLTVTALNVGNGSCLVLESPDGGVYLYDCGGQGSETVGSGIAAPYLWHRRIRRVDALFLSHEDSDHINGVAALIDRVPIGTVYVTPQFAASAAGGMLLEQLQTHGANIRKVSAGERIDTPELLFDVLYPPPDAQETIANNLSLLLRVRYGEGTVLLTGDLEDAGFSKITGLELRADLLEAPHHGSQLRDYDAILDRVRPDCVLVSARRNFSPSGVQARFAERGIVVRQTGWVGAVQVSLRKTGVIDDSKP